MKYRVAFTGETHRVFVVKHWRRWERESPITSDVYVLYDDRATAQAVADQGNERLRKKDAVQASQ